MISAKSGKQLGQLSQNSFIWTPNEEDFFSQKTNEEEGASTRKSLKAKLDQTPENSEPRL